MSSYRLIPSGERRKTQTEYGDRVEIHANTRGSLVVTKVPRIEDVRKRLSGKLRHWPELDDGRTKC